MLEAVLVWVARIAGVRVIVRVLVLGWSMTWEFSGSAKPQTGLASWSRYLGVVGEEYCSSLAAVRFPQPELQLERLCLPWVSLGLILREVVSRVIRR